MSYVKQLLVVGDTIDFKLYVRKDGVAWDITGATVLLYLTKPGGTALAPLTATVTGTSTAKHSGDEDLLDVSGDWKRRWKVSLGGIVLWSKPIPFPVLPSSG